MTKPIAFLNKSAPHWMEAWRWGYFIWQTESYGDSEYADAACTVMKSRPMPCTPAGDVIQDAANPTEALAIIEVLISKRKVEYAAYERAEEEQRIAWAAEARKQAREQRMRGAEFETW